MWKIEKHHLLITVTSIKNHIRMIICCHISVYRKYPSMEIVILIIVYKKPFCAHKYVHL